MILTGKRIGLTVAAAVAIMGTGIGAAYAGAAVTAAVIQPRAAYACEGSGHVVVTLLSTPSAACPAGTTSIVLGAQGPKGNTGAQGIQGPQGLKGDPGANGTNGADGAPGPSGVTAVMDESGQAVIANIGGSWSSRHTEVRSFTLPAGTYLVTLTGDFYQEAATTATPTLQVAMRGGGIGLTSYTSPFPSGEPAGKLSLGSDGTPNGIEQTAVATGIVVVASDSTITLNAFGYNVDTTGSGGGDFGVIVHASFAQVTPAS